ncbi:DUF748 domain-containing protein [Babesia caballi]|uniref:DUF748 domain-containing protein n=1 Tax=Babesia caballi TaxID=5871 RepID=A0AAV4LPM6_BABCB|nr:DUF748 domain-containing protein [Babesia caballi]
MRERPSEHGHDLVELVPHGGVEHGQRPHRETQKLLQVPAALLVILLGLRRRLGVVGDEEEARIDSKPASGEVIRVLHFGNRVVQQVDELRQRVLEDLLQEDGVSADGLDQSKQRADGVGETGAHVTLRNGPLLRPRFMGVRRHHPGESRERVAGSVPPTHGGRPGAVHVVYGRGFEIMADHVVQPVLLLRFHVLHGVLLGAPRFGYHFADKPLGEVLDVRCD